MRIHPVTLLLLALLPAGARAQEADDGLPDLVQELFTAENAYPQEAGGLQLTVRALLEDGATARLLAEYGITDHLQVSAGTPYLQLEEGGEKETSLGAQVALVNGPVLAASVSLEAAMVSGVGESTVEWEPALIVARRFGRVQAHGSVAAALARDRTELAPALALMVDAGRITPTLEGAATVAEGAAPGFAVTPGVFLRVGTRLEIGLGAPVNLGASDLPNAMVLVTVEL